MLSPPSTLLDMDAEHLQEWHFSLQLRPRVGRHPAGLALRRYTRAYALTYVELRVPGDRNGHDTDAHHQVVRYIVAARDHPGRAREGQATCTLYIPHSC